MRSHCIRLHENFPQGHLLTQEKERVKVHLNEMQVKISDQQSSIAVLQEEYEKAKAESKNLQEQVSVLSGQLLEKEREISNLKREIGDEKFQKCIVCHCEQGDEDKVRWLKEKLNKQAAIKREEKSEESCSEERHLQFNSEPENLKAENSSLKALKSSLEAKIQSLERDTEVKNRTLQQENMKSSQQLASLKGHLAKVSCDIDAYIFDGIYTVEYGICTQYVVIL